MTTSPFKALGFLTVFANVMGSENIVFGTITSCPVEMVQIDTWEKCEEAALSMGKRYWGGAGHSSNQDPPQCIYRTPDDDMYFNTHETGSYHRNDRLQVCEPANIVFGTISTCPIGMVQIDTSEKCEEAATIMGKGYWGGTGHSSSQDPTQCTYRTPDNDMYFNTHETGSYHRSDRLQVCEPANIDFGTISTCPSGMVQIDTWEKCEEAASIMGKGYWGGEGHSSSQDPPQCVYRTPDSDMYFNTHDTGSYHRGDRLQVCEAANP